MKASSLQLKSSAFTKILIEANQDYAAEQSQHVFSSYAESGLTSLVEIAEDADQKGHHFVKLAVRLPGTSDALAPYKLDIEIIGVFDCESCDAGITRLVGANGPAVLYGSVRELVMLLTARGPYPPLVLPTVHFLPPDLQVDEEGRLSEECEQTLLPGDHPEQP